MEDRRKFLKNRGGLLQNTNNSTLTQEKLQQNPASSSNPFYQGALQNQPQSMPNLTTSAQKQSTPLATLAGRTGPSSQLYQFDFSQEDLAALNSPSENVRFTSTVFPSLDKVNSLRLPVGCHVRPWFNAGETISIVDFFQLYREKTGKNPPKKFDIPRCTNCRAYVNGFFKFLDHGRKMQCNLCLLVQDVPAYYVAPLDESGRRADLHER